MPSERSSRPDRWRRAIAACGVLTSLVALAAIGQQGQAGLISLWLLCAGLALAALSMHAVRKERQAGELLERLGGRVRAGGGLWARPHSGPGTPGPRPRQEPAPGPLAVRAGCVTRGAPGLRPAANPRYP